MSLQYEIYSIELDKSKIINNFTSKNDETTKHLVENFVITHNSSLIEKSSTTYQISNNNEVIAYFVISLWSIYKSSKNNNFWIKQNLSHEWYSVINLEFLIRKPWKDFNWLWDAIFKFLWEIIEYINKKVHLKYIFISALRNRINYFENKWFIAMNPKSKLWWKNNIDMLLKI